MSKIKKMFNFEVKQIGNEEERTLEMVGSMETRDRDGDEIEVGGWDLTDYNNNPVVMGFHEYDKFPYARSKRTYVDLVSKKLKFEVQFPTLEELTSYPHSPDMIAEHAKNADMAYNMYRNGYMRAVSVGFIGKEWEPIEEDGKRTGGRRYKKQSLLELSLVPIPSQPGALAEARSKGVINDKELKELSRMANAETKKVVPYKSYPTEPESTAWDGPAEIAAAEVDDLKLMATWYDADNADTKQAYKLPHHRASDKHLIWRGVTAAMGALLGARGGTDIPEGDRKGVYSHLARHYEDFGKTAPDFKSYTDVELKAMFPVETKKPDLEGNPSVWDIMDAIRMAINPAGTFNSGGPWIEDLYPTNYPSGSVLIERTNKYYLYQYEYANGAATISTEYTELEEIYAPKTYRRKAGATLSAKNRELLAAVHEGMDGNLKKLKEFLDGVMPMEDDPMSMMTANMTAGMTMPTMEPMMSAMRTVIAEEVKQALEDLKSQVLLLSKQQDPNDAPEGEIDLDAIELPEPPKAAEDIELEIEPGELKNMIAETVRSLIQGGKLL